MRKCRFCHAAIDDAATTCPHCQRDLYPGRAAAAAEPPAVQEPTPPSDPVIARVSVVDVNIPFGSMVLLLVTWALAAIPAFIILFVIGAILAGVLTALVGGLSQ